MLGMKDDFENFKKASMLGKLGYGTKLLLKGTVNTGLALGIHSSKMILNHPNSTEEQKQKARDYLDKHDK